MPTGTGYNTLEGNEKLTQQMLDEQYKMQISMNKASKSLLRKHKAKKGILSKESIERARDSALKTASSFKNNQKAKALDEKIFTTEGPKVSSDSADGIKPAFDTSSGTAQSVEEEVGAKKGGLVEAMKADGAMTKEYLSDVGGILSGEKEAAEIASTGKTKMESLKSRSGKYLEDMGGGSKALGGAKIAGYMVGASMLTDMLNPFDDD